jgi:hypothetical protein
MTNKKSISKEKKLVCLVGILPILMDFMEDVKEDFPMIYKRQVKKSGNDFINEVYKMGDTLYKKMESEEDEELREFYNSVIEMGTVFRNWIAEL